MAKGGKPAVGAAEAAASSAGAEEEGEAVGWTSRATTWRASPWWGRRPASSSPPSSSPFDIGQCSKFAASQEFLFLSHAHADHVGCLELYVARRSRRNMAPPTIFVPACLADLVRNLFDVHRAMDQSDLSHKLVPLDVGEECEFGNGLKVRAFRTYHVVPSQLRPIGLNDLQDEDEAQAGVHWTPRERDQEAQGVRSSGSGSQVSR